MFFGIILVKKKKKKLYFKNVRNGFYSILKRIIIILNKISNKTNKFNEKKNINDGRSFASYKHQQGH